MHFTYEENLDLKSLLQGDVIARSPEIDELLLEVHPHYHHKDDYHYLMVLTQSCDLVPRFTGERCCKARYITVAAIRPMRVVLEREVRKYQRNPLESGLMLCDVSNLEKMREFVQRLLNNNEPEYFYLHAEPTVGFSESHCAFLALSIALKSDLHYEKLLNAKKLQLKEVFQHKLGWITGNMYSRVATDDWVPEVCTSEEFEADVSNILESLCLWVDPDIKNNLFREIKKTPEEERTSENIIRIYSELRSRVPKKKDVLLERLEAVLKEEGIQWDTRKKIKNIINSDSEIARCIAK